MLMSADDGPEKSMSKFRWNTFLGDLGRDQWHVGLNGTLKMSV